MSTEVTLGERYGEGGIGGEVECWVALPPVPVGRPSALRLAQLLKHMRHFITAMLTGASVLALYIFESLILPMTYVESRSVNPRRRSLDQR